MKVSEDIDPMIRNLYPHLSEDQLKEAEENLEAYVEAVLRIHERINAKEEFESRRG